MRLRSVRRVLEGRWDGQSWGVERGGAKKGMVADVLYT